MRNTNIFIYVTIFAHFIFDWSFGLSASVYSSLTFITSLLEFDINVANTIAITNIDTPHVKKFIDSHLLTKQDKQRYPEGIYSPFIYAHPLHVYAVIKRFILYWPKILEDFNRMTLEYTEVESLLYESHKNAALKALSKEDLTGAAYSLARLQKTYQIHFSNLTKGLIKHYNCSIELSAFDCAFIAKSCLDELNYDQAWQWMTAASHLETDPDMVYFYQIQQNTIALLHNEKWTKGPGFFEEPISNSIMKASPTTDFEKLCNISDSLQYSDPNLKCYVTDRNSPFMKLQPFNVEIISQSPEINIFYDVISFKEIEELQSIMLQRLIRSTIGGVNPGTHSEIRVSHTAWVDDADFPLVARLTQRVQDFTGLETINKPEDLRKSIFASEQLQVLSYGLGGCYTSHHDPLYKLISDVRGEATQIPPEGDRLATWMFYLSDVEEGGYTAFPLAGVAAPPVKGAAVFWRNIKRNGELDLRTLHGGCPTLIGHKWVANKWIHEEANLYNSLCDVDRQV